ncbi:MAG: SDR family oxidoreductase [Dehalococcoidia bacterium]|nr:SDR family oxidoreductase [Dehalococcoidia bacterium]
MTVVAIIGRGSDEDRAIAVACAEAGANIALGTMTTEQEQEYGMHSIANEVWSIGPEQLVCVMDAGDATEAMSFAAQVWDRFGRCDLLVANHDLPATAPLDQLSADELEETLRANLAAPFLAAHAFGRLMTRQGGGHILVVAHDRPGADAGYVAAKTGVTGFARAMTDGWASRGVIVEALQGVQDGKSLATTAVERLRRVQQKNRS